MSKNQFLIIVSLFIIIRLIFLFPIFQDEDKAGTNDSPGYEIIADNLIDGNGYSSCLEAPYYNNVIRTPGYPFFLSIVNNIYDSRILVVLCQCFLSLLTCFLTFKISSLLFNKKIGFISALLIALDFHLIAYDGSVMTESVFTFILTASIYFILRDRSYQQLLVYPCIAILLLVRPIALFLVPVFIAFSGYKIYQQKDKSKGHIRNILMSAVLGLILIFPWLRHYKNTTGNYGLSAMSSYNYYLTFANSYLARQSNENENNYRTRLIREMENPLYGDCQNNYGYIDEMERKGKKVMKENFFKYLIFHVWSAKTAFIPEVNRLHEIWGFSNGNLGTLAIINKEGILSGVKHYLQQIRGGILLIICSVFIWFIILFPAIIGTVYSVLSENKSTHFFILLICIYFIFVPGPASSPRFITPIVPLLSIYSAYGLCILIKNSKYLKGMKSVFYSKITDLSRSENYDK